MEVKLPNHNLAGQKRACCLVVVFTVFLLLLFVPVRTRQGLIDLNSGREVDRWSCLGLTYCTHELASELADSYHRHVGDWPEPDWRVMYTESLNLFGMPQVDAETFTLRGAHHEIERILRHGFSRELEPSAAEQLVLDALAMLAGFPSCYQDIAPTAERQLLKHAISDYCLGLDLACEQLAPDTRLLVEMLPEPLTSAPDVRRHIAEGGQPCILREAHGILRP